MYFRALAVAALLAPSLGCFVDNGADKPDSVTTTGATTTTATTATTAAPTTGLVDSSTTTGTTDPGTSLADTDLDPTTADDTTGVAPESCWDQGADGWPLKGTPLVDFKIEPSDPYLTPDGLDLYYLGVSDHRPYRSTRGSRLDPFPGGKILNQWNTLGDVAISHPIVLLTGDLLLLSIESDIHYATRTPDVDEQFSLPSPLPGVVNSDLQDTYPTATADGLLLIVQRNDGPPIGKLPYSFTFHQFTRASADLDVTFDGDQDVTPQLPPNNYASCPTLSPDGLHLFYTSNERPEIDFSLPGDFAVYYTRRDTRGAPWNPPTKLPGVVGGDSIACVTSVTADGCTLAYYTGNVLLLMPTGLFIADRAASP